MPKPKEINKEKRRSQTQKWRYNTSTHKYGWTPTLGSLSWYPDWEHFFLYKTFTKCGCIILHLKIILINCNSNHLVSSSLFCHKIICVSVSIVLSSFTYTLFNWIFFNSCAVDYWFTVNYLEHMNEYII